MKSVQTIRRFISNAWLVAAPLVIVFLLIAIPLCLAVVSAIIEHVFGPEVAEGFSTTLFGAMMWGGELVLGLAPIGLAIYGIVRLARWLVRKKES
jgi:hypothetical protein